MVARHGPQGAEHARVRAGAVERAEDDDEGALGQGEAGVLCPQTTPGQ